MTTQLEALKKAEEKMFYLLRDLEEETGLAVMRVDIDSNVFAEKTHWQKIAKVKIQLGLVSVD